MRLGVLSDIHGNSIALDAVLADAESLGVERYLVLGDHVAIGVDPVAVLERLTGLADATFVRGNTDRYVVTGDGPPPSLEEARADPELVERLAAMTALFVWTRGYVSAHGWFDWLADLQLEQRLTLPDGTRLLAVHASPGRDDGSGFHPGLSNDEMEALITVSDVDLVCGGHSHQPVDQRLQAASYRQPWQRKQPLRARPARQLRRHRRDRAGLRGISPPRRVRSRRCNSGPSSEATIRETISSSASSSESFWP